MFRSHRTLNHSLGSFPIGNVLLSTTLALLAMGLLGLLLMHAVALTRAMQTRVQMHVILHRNAPENTLMHLGPWLAQKAYVLDTQEGCSVRFVSKQTAAENFIKATGENFLSVLEDNPLRDAYVLHIEPSYQEKDSIRRIKQALEAHPGVFEVDYPEDLLTSVNRNVAKSCLVLVLLTMVLWTTVIVLVRSNVRLAMYSQRFLIRSMGLVGATKKFIRRPFVHRAALVGGASGTIAATLLLGLLSLANRNFHALAALQDPRHVYGLLVLLVAVGVLLSVWCTRSAVNRYVNMSTDALHVP